MKYEIVARFTVGAASWMAPGSGEMSWIAPASEGRHHRRGRLGARRLVRKWNRRDQPGNHIGPPMTWEYRRTIHRQPTWP